MSFFKDLIQKIKRNMFSYEDGFFIFPILASHPQTIIEGFKKTPFVKFIEEKRLAQMRTIFMDGDAYFSKIEDGLWFICSLLKFKKNVCFRVLLDPENPSPFYTLTINSNLSSGKIVRSFSGENLERMSYYWELVKPQSYNNDFNYAKTTTRVITFYLSIDWVNKQIIKPGLIDEKVSSWFRNDSNEILLMAHNAISNVVSLEALFDALEHQQAGRASELQLKANVMTFLSAFVSQLNRLDSSDMRILKPESEMTVLRVESLLRDSILSGFPSVTKLAKSVGMSETKLKMDFKAVFGTTLYRYYSKCQMDMAEQMIKSTNDSIKTIAYSLGYSHSGKFATAFKKIKGISPSQLRESKRDV